MDRAIVDLDCGQERTEVSEMVNYVVLGSFPLSGGVDRITAYEILKRDVYTLSVEAYWDGTLIVPPSTKTKGNHAYPFYHKGKW